MLKRIVPFLFFALAIQQAASLCACRADDPFLDAVAVESCSQWSDEQHDERILDVLSPAEKPCNSHLMIAPAVKQGKTDSEWVAPEWTPPAGWSILRPVMKLDVPRGSAVAEWIPPAVNLPLLN